MPSCYIHRLAHLNSHQRSYYRWRWWLTQRPTTDQLERMRLGTGVLSPKWDIISHTPPPRAQGPLQKRTTTGKLQDPAAQPHRELGAAATPHTNMTRTDQVWSWERSAWYPTPSWKATGNEQLLVRGELVFFKDVVLRKQTQGGTHLQHILG